MTTDDKTKPQYDVFLSYARADDDPDYDNPTKSFMRRLYNALTAEGFDVWWDRESMPNRGLTFSEDIQRAVKASRRLILIVGPCALTSEYVTKEWHTALLPDVCVPVKPILRKSDYTDLPAELAGIDTPDFRNDGEFENKLNYLVRQLNEEVPPPGRLHKAEQETFYHPQGYIFRHELWKKLDEAVRGDAISAKVATSREQSTALQGMAGLGKTTIAAAYAESCAVRRTFDSDVFWLTIGRAADVLAKLTGLAEMLGDDPGAYSDLETAVGRLSGLLKKRRTLIVADDVWERNVIDVLRRILSADCRLLFTTRDMRIVTLTRSQRIQVDSLSIDEGVRLIGRGLDRPAKDDFTEDNPFLESERAIVDLLQGHTLAVTLAGAHIAKIGAGYAPTLLSEYQLARETENPFADLDMDPEDRQWSVELSLRLSYDVLNNQGKRHFRALGVLAENVSFSRKLLTELWRTHSPDPSLRDLESTAMIEPKEDGGFGQHTILRAYAAALLRREGAYTATFNRYADYVIKESAQFETLSREKWDSLKPLFPHIHEVGDTLKSLIGTNKIAAESLSPITKLKSYIVRLLTRRQRQRASDFVHNIKNYVSDRPQAIEVNGQKRLRGMDWLEMGLKIAHETGDKKQEALLHNELGYAWYKLGHYREALFQYEKALPLRQEAGDQRGEAATLNSMGATKSELDLKDDALRDHEQALVLYRAVGDKQYEAITLNNIGLIWHDLDDNAKARDYYEQALPPLRAIPDKGSEAIVLTNIGEILVEENKIDEGLKYFEDALPLLRAVGDEGGEAYTLNYIGKIISDQGEKRKALGYFEDALPLAHKVGEQNTEAEILENMSSVYIALGDTAKAKEYTDLAETLRKELADGK